MIIVRAPLRISFVGGGTDIPDFYQHYPGQVLSATINKYVYVAINPAPLLKEYRAHYSIVERVKTIKELKNDRIRESLLKFGIKDYLEIGIFSHLPVGTGLGASSSFTVCLVKGLSYYLGKKLSNCQIAEEACNLEINLVKDPIGKQDQYAATFGGFNIFQFLPNRVKVEPLFLDFKTKLDLENHMLIFFTGITRQASSILADQKTNTQKNLETLREMASLVDVFKDKLTKGDFKSLGKILHKNWIKKKLLSNKISSQDIDVLYDAGIKNGAWGGKILGAGGGGCILLLAPLNKKQDIRTALKKTAKKLSLDDFKEVPVKFVQSGVEIVSNSCFN